MSIINLRIILYQFIVIDFPVYAITGTANKLETITKVVDMTTPLSSGVGIEHILNVNVSKLCNLNEIYSKTKFNSGERRMSEAKCSEYICDTTITEIDSKYYKSLITPYILGGRPALHGEFPHMGALGWRSAIKKTKWIYKCGATLISKKFMLTAAHCSSVPLSHGVANRNPEIVQLGDKFLYNDVEYARELKKCYRSFGDFIIEYKKHTGRTIDDIDGPKYVSIERIITHDDYNSPSKYYDIAIVELAEAVNFGPLIRPACLWNNPETSSLDKLFITGWGAIHADSDSGTDELQVAEVGIINDNTCDQLLEMRHSNKWHGLSDHQLCAGFLESGIDTCRGDSGGPLQVKINLRLRELITKWPMYYEVAVTSFSFKCGLPNTPSVYTKTSTFIDWIEDQVWPKDEIETTAH